MNTSLHRKGGHTALGNIYDRFLEHILALLVYGANGQYTQFQHDSTDSKLSQAYTLSKEDQSCRPLHRYGIPLHSIAELLLSPCT